MTSVASTAFCGGGGATRVERVGVLPLPSLERDWFVRVSCQGALIPPRSVLDHGRGRSFVAGSVKIQVSCTMFASLSDAGVLIPPPPASSLGFEATLSVAVELERRLNAKLHDPNNARAAKRADGSPTELPRNSPALPTGGAAKHHEDATTTDESLNESDHSSTCGVSRGEENATRARDEDDDVEDDEEDGNGTEETPLNNSLNYSFEWEGHLTKEEGSNGQRRGKTKTYRCKQCSFVATVKTDFWAHNKTHIKAEKLLTCPTCPFVTEYKHHLEYHLRNHYGSKPFKCSQCAYSCVNKSMLNSHLKSHSNVYQFRCADCNYATKYCHSLKLHLRKYSHKAATALAQDGSPNPVVDMFGSRRSSKNNKKNNNNTITEDSTSPLGHLHFAPPLPPALPLPQLPPLPFLFPVINGYHSSNYDSHLGIKNGECSANGVGHKIAELKCNLCEFTALGQEHLSKHMLAHAATENQDLCSLYGISSDALLDKKNNATELYLNAGVRLIENTRSIIFPSKPLDLSQRETKKDDEEESVPMTTQRHRRKGKAFKLDRLFLKFQEHQPEEDDDDEDDEQLAIRNQRQQQQQLQLQQQHHQQRRQQYQHDVDDDDDEEPPSPPPLLHANGKEVAQLQNINNNNNECPYCDIIFKDCVMYAVHMGYHGYQDPFQCNMCGQTSDDKVSFFLHIARTAHK